MVWIGVACLTEPTDHETLLSFYRLIRPAGPGWKRFRAETGITGAADSMPTALLSWGAGCAFVYASLFGTGSFLYGRTLQGGCWVAVWLASGFGLVRLLPRLWAAAADARA
jgi:SSS family solute:Na+ symporter